jgi:DNA-binding FadR family transcriptional regulator
MTRVADLTVEELVSIIRSAVREAIHEAPEANGVVENGHRNGTFIIPGSNPRLLLDVPPSTIRLQPDMRSKLLSREEYYDDDGR